MGHVKSHQILFSLINLPSSISVILFDLLLCDGKSAYKNHDYADFCLCKIMKATFKRLVITSSFLDLSPYCRYLLYSFD